MRRLTEASRYPHPLRDPRLLETHISWVLLTGDYAYKIKKPVDLGFLDYTTLEKRRFYCEEELRLNGRLSPDIYLAVVPITGSPESPVIEGQGPVVDYAVKMRQFDQADLLDRRLEAGRLDGPAIDRVADVVADFHAAIPAVTGGSELGTPARVLEPALENFRQLDATAPDDMKDALGDLEAWTRRVHGELEATFQARRHDGFVRECHGDMHLGNMAEVEGELRIFDGIEFNEALRWVDVMSEAAFVLTDLNHRGRRDLGWRFLNRYLEGTGDYSGLAVLAFYRVYRLMVRAKVDAIRLGQLEAGSEEWRRDRREVDAYLEQAQGVTAPASPALILMRGVSGSGKSWLSAGLLEEQEAVRLRSDVERKRLFGLARNESSRSVGAAGIYTAEASRRTFERLRELAGGVLDAGLRAIIDATFLSPGDRQPFHELAAERRCPLLILDVRVSPAMARRRVGRRETGDSDPSEAGPTVLERQLEGYAPLAEEERRLALEVNGDAPPRFADLAAAVEERLRSQVGLQPDRG